jgi:hypothetical protein
MTDLSGLSGSTEQVSSGQNLAYLALHEARALLRRKEISSVELTQATLDRLWTTTSKPT